MVQAGRVTPRARDRRGRATRSPAPPIHVLATFLAPALLLYSVFVVYPLFSALQYSLFDWEGTARRAFVGTQNFVDLFTTFPLDEQLVSAFGHNVVFFLGTMLIQNTLGLTFAVLLLPATDHQAPVPDALHAALPGQPAGRRLPVGADAAAAVRGAERPASMPSGCSPCRSPGWGSPTRRCRSSS